MSVSGIIKTFQQIPSFHWNLIIDHSVIFFHDDWRMMAQWCKTIIHERWRIKFSLECKGCLWKSNFDTMASSTSNSVDRGHHAGEPLCYVPCSTYALQVTTPQESDQSCHMNMTYDTRRMAWILAIWQGGQWQHSLWVPYVQRGCTRVIGKAPSLLTVQCSWWQPIANSWVAPCHELQCPAYRPRAIQLASCSYLAVYHFQNKDN